LVPGVVGEINLGIAETEGAPNAVLGFPRTVGRFGDGVGLKVFPVAIDAVPPDGALGPVAAADDDKLIVIVVFFGMLLIVSPSTSSIEESRVKNADEALSVVFVCVVSQDVVMLLLGIGVTGTAMIPNALGGVVLLVVLPFV